MPLDCHRPPVIAVPLYCFDNSVWRSRCHSKSVAELGDGLVVQRIDGNFGCSDCFRRERSRLDRHWVNSRIPVIVGVVIQRSRNFGRNVLYQGSAECNVQELWAAANGEQRFPEVTSGEDEGDLCLVPGGVRLAAFFSSGLSVQTRVYIFAPSQKQSIDAREYQSGVVGCRKGRNYDWYEPCTLQSDNVRAVQSESMSAAEPSVRCGGYRDYRCQVPSASTVRAGNILRERG